MSQSLYGHLLGPKCGHHYYGYVEVLLTYPCQNLHATHVRHRDIEQYQVGATPANERQSISAAICFLHQIARCLQF